MAKTMPDWDGQTVNGRPYISTDSDREVECTVRTHQGTDDEGNIVYANECGWTGPVNELERGKPMMGSKPTKLLCPECGRHLASAKGTTGAGYWGNALDG